MTATPGTTEPSLPSKESWTPSAETEADRTFETLAKARFHSIVERSPVLGTYLGLSEYDDKLSDGSRDAALADIEDSRRYLAEVEAFDPDELSPYFAFERELALYATRRQIFEDDVYRIWERRPSAADEIGDGIFLTFSRASRPLAERLSSIAARLEAAPKHIEQQTTRIASTPVRLWNELELEAASTLPSLFDDVIAAARSQLPDDPVVDRLVDAAAAASTALDGYQRWIKELLSGATDEFALGSELLDEAVRLRAFDGLDTDAVLAIGEEQLASLTEARAHGAAEIDRSATVEEVVDRIKADHAPDFAGALAAYRAAMAESRQFVLDNGIASLPEREAIDVIETPEYMRSVLPFAAYYQPPRFGRGDGELHGLYLVTPSVDGQDGALREHNYASLYNTSIHEAYPGHHQQLAISINHPSYVRVLLDAPEFTEGWAMYCEQMMREEGFDTDPRHIVMMYTDAIWRACRIILDVKLQRREISVADATDFLVKNTGFERANAAAEVNWYTYRPTYPMSYLLGKVMLLRLRDDEKRRLGDRFSLRRFHDTMLREGSVPISFHRRVLAGSQA